MAVGDGLIERRAETRLIEGLLSRAPAGSGGLVVLEGTPGEGKTSVLAEAEAEATGRFTVRSVRSSELEQAVAWGVARELLARPAREAGESVLPAAAAALGLGHTDGRADDPLAVSFALTELCSDLAAESPLLIIVDDAHWADPLSVRWLVHLAGRIEQLPIAVLAAVRPHDPRRPAELDLLSGRDGVRTHRLHPLSESGTASLVRRFLPSAGDELRSACHDASGGNPFLVVELLRELAARSSVPTPADIADVAIDRIERVAARRIGAAGDHAAELVRAAAISGPAASAAAVAAVAGLDPPIARATADALRAAGILGPDSVQLEFAHPLLRSAVERSIPVGERTRLHLAAAHELDRQGEAPERIAAHLMASEPGSDPWVRGHLVTAGDRAMEAGAPKEAMALYQRASAERVGVDVALLLAMGRAAAGVDPVAAEAPLRAALGATADPEERVPIALQLTVVLQSLRRFAECVELLQSLLSDLAASGADRGPWLRVEAELLAQGFFDLGSREERARRLASAALEVRGEDEEESLILVQLAIRAVNTGTASEACRLADEAWAGGRLYEVGGGMVSPAVQWVPYIFLYVDQPGRSLSIAEDWLRDARRQGSAVAACFAELMRAESLRRLGRLVDARGAAEVAWALASEIGPQFPGWWEAIGALAQALLATDETSAALELVHGGGLLEGPPPEIMLLPCPRIIRAECLLAAGQLEQGVAEHLATLKWLEQQAEPSPGAWHFQAGLVDALLALGRRAEAADVAEDWLHLTEAFGAATTFGMAVRSLALTGSGDGQVAGLRRAEEILSGCPSRWEHARALVELGAALRRAGQRGEAREPLRRGLDLASRCGDGRLASRAREELTAAGARPRRDVLSGVDALSPSERRVAQLAGSGMTNREVASALFISRKTVEHHLGSIYAKLGTNDRDQLGVLMS